VPMGKFQSWRRRFDTVDAKKNGAYPSSSKVFYTTI
jgi:hypothetical protein